MLSKCLNLFQRDGYLGTKLIKIGKTTIFRREKNDLKEFFLTSMCQCFANLQTCV